MSAPLLIGPGLVARRVRVPKDQVMILRYLVEAYDGLANLHGSAEGTITLVTTEDRAAELDSLLRDLAEELPIEVER